MTNTPVVQDLNLFPTLVRQVKSFLTPAECALIVANTNQTKFGSHDALTMPARSSFTRVKSNNTALDNIDSYLPIKARLLFQINAYTSTFGIDKVILDNSWINIQNAGSVLKYHTHQLSCISGVIYLKTDTNSSHLSFCNPNPFIDLVDTSEWTPYTFKTVYVPPEIGDLILFPSWLKHGTDSPNNSAERISLSFNTR